VLYRGDLWHGAAASGDRGSRIVQIQYGEKSWKTAGEPIKRPECFSPEIVSRLTLRQRVLMGEASKGIFL
jgi:hypothetical protein